MRTRNFKRIIDNWLLTGLAIGMILLFGTLLTDTLGLGPWACPECTRWNGITCQPYCDEFMCQICGPLSFCCPNGRCAPLGQICCGTTFCPPDDGCCENIACRIPGCICCNNGTGHSCPPGYSCHGAYTCCPPGGDYCPGHFEPPFLFDCCPPNQHCVGNGRCCPNGTNLCEGPGGMWSCCNPSVCEETCINGECLPCGGDPNKFCCNGECYDPNTQTCCGGVVHDLGDCMGCLIGAWIYMCAPEFCQSCVEDQCLPCGGDTTKCCKNNGTCVPKCENTGQCDYGELPDADYTPCRNPDPSSLGQCPEGVEGALCNHRVINYGNDAKCASCAPNCPKERVDDCAEITPISCYEDCCIMVCVCICTQGGMPWYQGDHYICDE